MPHATLEAGPPTRVTLAAVRAALRAEPRIDVGHHPLRLAVDDGVLTMEGEVADAAARALALERAAAVAGVHHIVDRLRVRPARRMGDAEIRDHLRDALAAEPALQGIPLEVRAGRAGHGEATSGVVATVEGGVVTLAGIVPSLGHKRLAGVLAWWVPATRAVVNGLEVAPPEEDGDDEISDAVRIALEKDPLVDAGQVRVVTRDGRVTLDGVVSSPEQREVAELDAWFVFGVDRVVNRLGVRALERAARG